MRRRLRQPERLLVSPCAKFKDHDPAFLCLAPPLDWREVAALMAVMR